MVCTKEPDATGRIALGGCRENWNTVILHWTPGQDCDPADDECGRREFSLASVTGTDPLTADIEVQLVEKNHKLAIAQHDLDIRFGVLIDFTLERVLMPLLFGDGEDGLPQVDTFEKLIGALLAGRPCLDAAGTSCCASFATNLSGQAGVTLSASAIEGACDALVTQGAAYIRDFLLGLDGATGGFTIGTPTDQPCAIVDSDGNMKYDALGRSRPRRPVAPGTPR